MLINVFIHKKKTSMRLQRKKAYGIFLYILIALLGLGGQDDEAIEELYFLTIQMLDSQISNMDTLLRSWVVKWGFHRRSVGFMLLAFLFFYICFGVFIAVHHQYAVHQCCIFSLVTLP